MEKEMAKVIRSWGNPPYAGDPRKFVWDFVRNQHMGDLYANFIWCECPRLAGLGVACLNVIFPFLS
jgi:hypothetical protein